MEIYTLLSIFSLLIAFGSTLAVLAYIIRNPQPMKVMNAVWPLTTLWGGLATLWAFLSFGSPSRSSSKSTGTSSVPVDSKKPSERFITRSSEISSGASAEKLFPKPPSSVAEASRLSPHMSMSSSAISSSSMPMDMNRDMGNQPFWQKVTLSTFHCGAGCTLADLIGEWLGPFFLVAIGLRGIVWMWILDYILALLIGAYFQYAAIRPTLPQLSAGKVFARAMKIDFLSLTSWQIGMYAFSYFVFFIILPAPLPNTTWTFWYTMQLAMCVGFLFSYPMNWFLIRKGIKPAM